MTISGELRDVWEDSGVCWAWWLLMLMNWAELTRAKYCAVQLINCCCLEACTLLHVSLLWTSLWLQITGDQGKQCHLWFQLIGYGNCVGTSVGKKQRWPWFEPLQGSGLFPGGTIGAMVGLNTSKFPYTEISWLVKWVCDPYMVWMDVMSLLWWTIGCSMTCWHDCGNLNKLWATSIDQVNESWWNQLMCGLACCQIAGTDSIPSWWKESGQPDSLQTVKRAMTLAGQSESYWHTWWSTNGLVTPLWKVQVGLWKTTGSI